MPKLFNREYSKSELLKTTGDISQIGGVKAYELNDGKEKGVEAIDFRTGTGFNFTVLPGRGMDISFAEFKGIPLCWVSPTGIVSPEYFEPTGNGWLRNFFGGLLTTCGMTYAGAANIDQGVELGLHGRASNIAAKNVYHDGEWQGDEYRMFAQGKVREVSALGENVLMTRKISAKLGESRLFIDDVIENCGHEKAEHMMLYHINIGFPVLSEQARLISPTVKVISRDEEARKGEKNYNTFTPPINGIKEQCYDHEMKPDEKGMVTVALINKAFNQNEGIGIYIKYNIREFPNFVQWKMLKEGAYVVGLEPASCWIEARADKKKKGTLEYLKPGEKKEYHLEIGVLDTREKIAEFDN